VIPVPIYHLAEELSQTNTYIKILIAQVERLNRKFDKVIELSAQQPAEK
jgi:hypothetical protein